MVRGHSTRDVVDGVCGLMELLNSGLNLCQRFVEEGLALAKKAFIDGGELSAGAACSVVDDDCEPNKSSKGSKESEWNGREQRRPLPVTRSTRLIWLHQAIPHERLSGT